MGDGEPEEKITTPQPDARFQSTNVATWCFSTFVDYHRCRRLLGDDNECCEQFAKIFKSICPNEWVSRWENQIQSGTFPLDLPAEGECKNSN